MRNPARSSAVALHGCLCPLVARAHLTLEEGATPLATRTESPVARGETAVDTEFADAMTDEIAAKVEAEDVEAAAIDPVRAYLREIGRVPLLTAAQEVELSQRIEAGLYAQWLLDRSAAGEPAEPRVEVTADELRRLAADGRRAKDQLLEANLRLVVSVAKRYPGAPLTLLDLVQEGNLGLVRAVEKFDYAKGFKFSTYATWWIRQAITRAIAEQGRTIRLPVHQHEILSKLRRLGRQLAVEFGRDATPDELAAAAEMEPERVAELLRHDVAPVSLEMRVGDDEDTEFGSFIEDTDAVQPEAAVEFAGMQEQLARALELLDDREARLLALRFGLVDGRSRTLAEVGNELGLTRERVRQLERGALATLRRHEASAALRFFAA
jgi:RNA polymerase primary sigma factor